MKKLQVCSLTVLFSTVAFVPNSWAAVPPLSTQVTQVASWFSGLFNNADQVASNSMIPFITMSNCGVELANTNPTNDVETLFLEQTTGGSPFRVRFYSFGVEDSQLTLSVSSFLDQTPLLGLCDRPQAERVIDPGNILTESCDVNLSWEPTRYIGTNAPDGCPTSFPGGKVVSDIEIFADGSNSLDQIFDANGNLVFGTTIEFRQAQAVPEPSVTLGLIFLSSLGLAATFKPNRSHSKPVKKP